MKLYPTPSAKKAKLPQFLASSSFLPTLMPTQRTAGCDDHRPGYLVRFPVHIARLVFAVLHASAAEMYGNWLDAHWRGLPALGTLTETEACAGSR
jgi:hypothetical protein